MRSAGADSSKEQEAEESEARTRLILAEARRTAAETKRIEAETSDLDFAIFRKGAFFVLGLALAVILIVRLLLDPSLLDAVGLGGAAAAGRWLGWWR